MKARASYETLLQDDGPCLSILLPVDPSQDRAHGGRSRLRRLLREAAHRAERNGLSLSDSAAMLGPWEGLMEQSSFWRGVGNGLALLSSPRATAALWLSEPVHEGLRLAPRFSVLPLLRLRDRRPFHLLSLSHKHVRLMRWDGESAVEVAVPGMPASVEAALGNSQPRELQFHGAGRNRRRVGHGGEAGQDDKQDLKTFFHRVDTAVRAHFERAGQGPVVLAGVQYLQSIYREVSRLPRLVPVGLVGNFDRLGPEKLCARALPVLSEARRGEWRHDLERFAALSGTGKTSVDPVELKDQALRGRVATLFLRDPGGIEALAEPLELAAVDVLRRGGTVHLVPPAEMPGLAAGILRA